MHIEDQIIRENMKSSKSFKMNVKMLVPESELIKEDRNEHQDIVQDRTIYADTEEEALYEFHTTVPIACVDHFEVTAEEVTRG